MTATNQPLAFTSTTPRLGLPQLFAAQAQKEFTVNHALALVDSLLHSSVAGIASAPPPAPAEGDAWIVGPAATGLFAGQEDSLACFQAGTWLFTPAVSGMRVFDRQAEQFLLYNAVWEGPAAFTPPTGGAVIDVEARAALIAISEALVIAGVLPTQ